MGSVDTYTTVDVSGSAEAPYDVVTFSVRVEGNGKNLAEAKQKADDLMRMVDECIKTLTDTQKLYIEPNTKRLVPIPTRMNRDPAGRGKKDTETTTCGYIYSFTSLKIECATEVTEAMGLLDKQGIAPSVQFSLRDLRALNKRAFENAFKNANERFADECSVRRVNPKRFEVGSYRTRYDESKKYQGSVAESAGRVVMASLASVEDERRPVQIDPGMAKITVYLEAAYVKKLKPVPRRKSVAKKK